MLFHKENGVFKNRKKLLLMFCLYIAHEKCTQSKELFDIKTKGDISRIMIHVVPIRLKFFGVDNGLVFK